MGGVNNSPTYVTTMRMGKPDGTVTDPTHQGGIVSVYYLGAIFGCFAGGWLADRIGRINGLLMGAVFALVGGALQSAIQSSDFMICARVVTGIGTGGVLGPSSPLSSVRRPSLDILLIRAHSLDRHHPRSGFGDLVCKSSRQLSRLRLYRKL